MTRDLLKKLVIGGAIVLSAAIPVFGQQGQVKSEKQVLSVQRDPFVPPKHSSYLVRQEEKIVKSLDELVTRLEKDGFDKNQIWAAYADKRFVIERDIIRYFNGSPETKGAKGKISYDEYKENLGFKKKLGTAPDFMKQYKEELALAEKKYGVDKRYIAAILGVESDFGDNKGRYFAFNALASMYTTRKKNFAYKELKEYVAMCKKANKGLFDYTSSYAAALGHAQFIPSSFNRIFIDGNGDLIPDPFCMEDCIQSVAKYLKVGGWNSKANGKIPAEKSRNWEAIKSYNKSSFYVKAIIELATKAKWNTEDLRVVPSGIADFE